MHRNCVLKIKEFLCSRAQTILSTAEQLLKNEDCMQCLSLMMLYLHLSPNSGFIIRYKCHGSFLYNMEIRQVFMIAIYDRLWYTTSLVFPFRQL